MKYHDLKEIIIERQENTLKIIQRMIDDYFDSDHKQDIDILTNIARVINEQDKCERTDLGAYEFDANEEYYGGFKK